MPAMVRGGFTSSRARVPQGAAILILVCLVLASGTTDVRSAQGQTPATSQQATSKPLDAPPDAPTLLAEIDQALRLADEEARLLHALRDRTHTFHEPALSLLLARSRGLPAIPPKVTPAVLDHPGYLALLEHPDRYRARAVQVRLEVLQVIRQTPGRDMPATAWWPAQAGAVWRVEGFEVCADGAARADLPWIMVTGSDPSAVLGEPDRTGPAGVAVYDRRLPVVDAAAVFCKLYTTQDSRGQLRDYPVAVAWQLVAVRPARGQPRRLPSGLIVVGAVLVVAWVLIRMRLRRSVENAPARWQYRPRRDSLSDDTRGAGPRGQAPGGPAPVEQGATLMQRTITVSLGERSYDVRIAPGELDRLGAAAAALPAAHLTVVIADATVAELYGAKAVKSLEAAGLTAALVDFPAGEEHKTLATFGHVMDELLAVSPPIDRDSLIVALGGGVTGDLAGFVAASALRGLRWIQCPTTLLADVDSSVGGKTALDHPAGKNLIGAFHQPVAVLIDVSVLGSLDGRQIRTGLAECVKHGMIRDAGLLDFIEANAEALLAAEEDAMTELIARNVAIKAAVVSADERESGERSHLNFGHTVAHAIETHLGLGAITHGEAVSLGMVAECRLAVTRGLAQAAVLERLEGLLEKLHLPTRRPGLDVNALWAIMQHDKKVRAGQVRMVLPTALGQVDVFDDIQEPELAEVLAALRG